MEVIALVPARLSTWIPFRDTSIPLCWEALAFLRAAPSSCQGTCWVAGCNTARLPPGFLRLRRGAPALRCVGPAPRGPR